MTIAQATPEKQLRSFVFRWADILDGSGGPSFRADVGIAGGRIVGIDSRVDIPGAEIVDAAGLVLAPGFIDIHGHSDISIFRHSGAESKLFQGVTLEVVGNCGISAFPVSTDPGLMHDLADFLRIHDVFLPPGGFNWTSFSEFATQVERIHPGVHLAPLVGHAALRIATMGMEERAAAPAEISLMQQLLAELLEQGAWGMSTGLIYPPGSFAGTDELVSLGTTVARFGALCTSHIRGEGDGLMASLDEAIAIAAASGCRMQVSHLKALGRNNRGKGTDALLRLSRAREQGVDIGADQYPYAASATSLTAVVPQWAHAGGVAKLLQRLVDPAHALRLSAEIAGEIDRREGAGGIVVSSCPSEKNRPLAGQTLAAIAAGWRCEPAEAVIRLLSEERGEVPAVFFSMAEDDVRTILRDTTVAVGSDGHALNLQGEGDATHPRSYGCFPRVLGRYVREEKVLELPAAVYKMTGLPAKRLGISDRGLIREGMVADVVLFDPATVKDNADYRFPHRYSSGIVHLLMEGHRVIEDGSLTGISAGRVLRRPEKGVRV